MGELDKTKRILSTYITGSSLQVSLEDEYIKLAEVGSNATYNRILINLREADKLVEYIQEVKKRREQNG